MIAFLTALMDGHWLAVFAGWIWNNVFIAGTAGSWSIYTATFGHTGFLWWGWAVFWLIVALVLILFVWFGTFLLYVIWFGAWVAWIFLWIYYLIGKFIVWFAILIWHFVGWLCIQIGHLAVWIWSWLWPALILFIKAFMLPVLAAAAFRDMHRSHDWRWRTTFAFLYPTYWVALFFVFPPSWAIWFYSITFLYFFIFVFEVDKPILATT